MKTSLLIIGLFVLAGCSSAPYLDAEYGLANQEAQDRQIAYPDAPFATTTPAGLDGIMAEEVMKAHSKTYAEKPVQTETLSFGLIGDSQGGK